MPENPCVPGSIPGPGTSKFKGLSQRWLNPFLFGLWFILPWSHINENQWNNPTNSQNTVANLSLVNQFKLTPCFLNLLFITALKMIERSFSV
jgi:hypothetical protein